MPVTRDRPTNLLPGDRVSFAYRGDRISGTVVRAARSTAAVQAPDGGLFRVPWGLLSPDGAGDAAEGLRAVAARAGVLLAEHGLDGWTFGFDHAKLRGGACHYRRKLVSMAVGFAQAASDAEVEDTLLHEIAHALVGPAHGHDAVWKAKARELGCSAQRCHSVSFAEPAFTAKCENGCFAVGKHRRRRNMRCRRCGGKVAYVRAAAG
jgi:predicted SprT family Zn-dependent metalloprotease